MQQGHARQPERRVVALHRGQAAQPERGRVPLNPGATVPPGTRVGITWSGCYGNGSTVPAVVGLTFAAARRALHAVGLTWACYSVGKRRPPRLHDQRRGDDHHGQGPADRAEPGPGRGHRAHAGCPGEDHDAHLSAVSGGSDPAGGPHPSGTAADPLALSSGRGRWVVAATVLGSGIAMLDSTVVGIALPSIGRDFHGGVGTLQWVVTGYALTLAAFLLLGGSLGDRYGRKRIFSVGVVWFAVASACCGVAPSAGLLIAARVVQGVGGALLTPASLAILQASFRPEDRARAIGAWSGLSGVAAAAGPLVGGYLIAIGSWRWVFYINLPVAAAVLAITARHVPETRDPTSAGRVDAVGAGAGRRVPGRPDLRAHRGPDAAAGRARPWWRASSSPP